MTTKRCRVGDLAVIVSADIPENIGRFCVVLEESEPHMNEPAWWIRMCGGPGMRRDGPAYEGRIRDKRLQPIRGPKDDSLSQVDKETAVPAVRT